MIAALVITLLWIGIGFGAYQLAVAGIAAGDAPGDAYTTVQPNQDGLVVRVSNPGQAVVAVGATIVVDRAPWWRSLRAATVIRCGRWYERRRMDRGASLMLGAVAGHEDGMWSMPAHGPSRVRIVIGYPDGRLRVHEHLVTTPYRPDAEDHRMTA